MHSEEFVKDVLDNGVKNISAIDFDDQNFKKSVLFTFGLVFIMIFLGKIDFVLTAFIAKLAFLLGFGMTIYGCVLGFGSKAVLFCDNGDIWQTLKIVAYPFLGYIGVSLLDGWLFGGFFLSSNITSAIFLFGLVGWSFFLVIKVAAANARLNSVLAIHEVVAVLFAKIFLALGSIALLWVGIQNISSNSDKKRTAQTNLEYQKARDGTYGAVVGLALIAGFLYWLRRKVINVGIVMSGRGFQVES